MATQNPWQPRARAKHVAVTVGKEMYVWGGWTGTDQYSRIMANYVEIFDFTSGVWSCKKTSGIPPRGLIDSAAACVGGSKLYVFGGYDGMLTKQCTNDLHELDLNTFEWRKVVAHNYLDIVDNPRPMHGARMCAHGGGLLVLYGGVLSSGQNSGDIFVYEITNGIWEKLATTGNKPPPLNGHTLTQIDASRVMLFGGQKDDGSCLNDVYILGIDTLKWTKVFFGISGVKPASRVNHSTCYISSPLNNMAGLVLVTGGKDSNGSVLNDLWVLDLGEHNIWKQVDMIDQEKPRHSHCTVMFRAGARGERIVVVTNGGQDNTDCGQPLGLATPNLINSVFYLEHKLHSHVWNGTRIIYKSMNHSVPAQTTSAPGVCVRPQSTPNAMTHDHLREFSVHLKQPAPDVNRVCIPQSSERREDFMQRLGSFPSRDEVARALTRADEMEKKAKEAEQNLADALHQLEVAQSKVATLKKMLENEHEKVAVLSQNLPTQRDDLQQSSCRGAITTSAMQGATDTKVCVRLAEVQQSQMKDKIKSLQTQLTKANEKNVHFQQELSSLEKCFTEADQRANQAELYAKEVKQRVNVAEVNATQSEKRATQAEQKIEEMSQSLAQLERRAIEAEASSNQSERNAQRSQDQAIDSEIRAREAERRMAELEQQLRDANATTERAERRAAFVDRGEERTWAVDRDEINLTDTELGRGGWAVVKVAEFRGIRVAAKCIYNNILSDHNRALFVREMNMAARLRHPNLVQFVGATIVGDPLILMEILPTTLRIELRHGPPNHAQIVAISKDVAKALNYMHLMQPDPLMHRDVSSANVLLERSSDNMWKGKLSDYGSINFVQRALSAGPGNPLYAAPEANDPRLHSPKMDVYSFGVLLSEMCSGRFPDADCRVLVERVADQQMAKLIKRCVKVKKNKRPIISDVLADLAKCSLN